MGGMSVTVATLYHTECQELSGFFLTVVKTDAKRKSETHKSGGHTPAGFTPNRGAYAPRSCACSIYAKITPCTFSSLRRLTHNGCREMKEDSSAESREKSIINTAKPSTQIYLGSKNTRQANAKESRFSLTASMQRFSLSNFRRLSRIGTG